MAKIKVPYIDPRTGQTTEREIELTLHAPCGPETPWFVSADQTQKVTPEEFAADWFNPEIPPREFAVIMAPNEAAAAKESARRFEHALRKAKARAAGVGRGGRGRGGAPVATIFSVAEDIAVLASHCMDGGLKRGTAIDRALAWWQNGNKARNEPSGRLIDAALARIRRGGVANLPGLVEAVRRKYGLPEIQLHGAKGATRRRIK